MSRRHSSWARSSVFWATTEGAVAAVPLLTGGLVAMQTFQLTTGLPLALILLAMCMSLHKALAADLNDVEGLAEVADEQPQATVTHSRANESIDFVVICRTGACAVAHTPRRRRRQVTPTRSTGSSVRNHPTVGVGQVPGLCHPNAPLVRLCSSGSRREGTRDDR